MTVLPSYWLHGSDLPVGERPREPARQQPRELLSSNSEIPFPGEARFQLSAFQLLAPIDAKRAIAHDSTKMASAAFETMLGITALGNLPKSNAWSLIRAY